MRRDKINYYLDIAQTVAERSTCLRKKYGSIIVKNDEIIATGYVGAPRGRKNCSDLGSVSYTHLVSLWPSPFPPSNGTPSKKPS